MILQKE